MGCAGIIALTDDAGVGPFQATWMVMRKRLNGQRNRFRRRRRLRQNREDGNHQGQSEGRKEDPAARQARSKHCQRLAISDPAKQARLLSVATIL
jgi:hypothetical protein